MKTIELQDGDVITATSEDFPLFIEHQGIICYDSLGRCFIYHTVPGLDIEKDTIDVFFKKRKFKTITRTRTNRKQIEHRIKDIGEIPYNVVSFNCYDFINYLISPLH